MATTTRRAVALGLGVVIMAAAAAPVLAHHGWRWTADGNFELTGIITSVKLGNPHGIVTVDADGEEWTVEVGQPWRNERAGIEDGMLAPGVELTASGHRSASETEHLMKAERLFIDGTRYDLYPDRE